MDWGYLSVPQIDAGNRTIHYAQGKTLGGSSSINTMAYHRATIGAYQRWANLVGDQSYIFASLLPFFKKSAFLWSPNFTKRDTPNATFPYHSSAFDNYLEGPLQAIRSLGLPESIVGLNSGQLTGLSAYVTTTVDPRDAKRSSSQTSYLEKVGPPVGLKVYNQALAHKILFKGTCASGVQVVSENGTPYTLTARKEVILSAGVFGSPHLLMISGVGPAALLRRYGISIVSDLAGVGQNLWDQLIFAVINVVSTPSGPQEEIANPAKVNEEYHKQQWGPLSSISAYIAFEKLPAMLRSKFSTAAQTALNWFPADWPKVEYVAGSAAGPGGTTLGVLSVVLTAPLSRGNVSIQSSDPLVPPVINLGWLTNAVDREVAIAGLKRARNAWNNVTSIKVGAEIAPGDSIQTDEEILAYIQNSATQVWHAGATCKMGQERDANAVVDSSAKVFGVTKLRVVDAIALPFMVPGHPQSTVYMLAEKIAHDIVKSI